MTLVLIAFSEGTTMTNKAAALKTINEALTSQIHLVSLNDRENISEATERSQKRLGLILTSLNETRIDEESIVRLNEELQLEAVKLERLMIMEGAADKNFFELQKNFRSMVRAANVLVKWFPDSQLAGKMGELRTQGIELLSSLYDHIKQLETMENQGTAGVKLDPSMSKQRDQFMRVYTDFAVLFRGMMAVADLFSEDPTRVGGSGDVKSIFQTLERDPELGDEALSSACAIYDESAGKRNAMPGKTGIPDKKVGMMGKMFGGGGGTLKKLQHGLVQAIQSTSPGFGKIVPVQDVVFAITSRSLDQLRAYFGKFNDYVAADVDVNFLLQVAKNPRTISSLFKGVWDSLSGGYSAPTRGIR